VRSVSFPFGLVVVGDGGLVNGLLLCGSYFMIRSKVGLCRSFISSFFVLRLCMWNLSGVFSRGPFFRCEVWPLVFLLCRVCHRL
jgi:hypothetical protein